MLIKTLEESSINKLKFLILYVNPNIHKVIYKYDIKRFSFIIIKKMLIMEELFEVNYIYYENIKFIDSIYLNYNYKTFYYIKSNEISGFIIDK